MTQITLPPNTRVVYQPNPAGDMDQVVTALMAASATSFCMPTGDTSGVNDAANVQAAINATGYAVLAPGTYYGNTTVTGAAGQYIVVPYGWWSATWNWKGTGAAFRFVDTSGNYLPGGGGIKGGLIIDGTSAGAGSYAVHAGDIYNMCLEAGAQNFTGSGDIGFWLDNQYLYTEQMHGRIWVHKCSTGVQFDNSTGTGTSANATGSFDRVCLTILLDQKGQGNCVVFANGAFMEDFDLAILGNTDYGSALYYALTLTGSNAGGYSRLGATGGGSSGILKAGVECNGTSGTQPGTINFASAGNNTIMGCTGFIDFAGNNAFASANNFSGSFQFDGPVYGDTKLMRTTGIGMQAYEFGVPSNGSTIYTRYASLVKVVPGSGGVTGLILQAGSVAGIAATQTVTVMNAGTGPMSFAAAGTSNVAQGANDMIPANCAATYIWNADSNIWVRVAGPPGVPTQDMTLYLAPSGATAETYSRTLNSQYTAALTTQQTYVSAIPLPGGLTVSDLAVIIGSGTGFTGVSHGWLALLDSGRVVRAVTADQTSSFGSASTPLSLPVGTPYVVPAAGLYYLMACVTATTMGLLAVGTQPLTGSATAAPILCGTSSASQTTPPIVGTTMGAITANGAWRFYGYTS